MKYDVVIIGGGPAGMMAAISASSLGAKVIIIEKNEKLGNKLLLTGGGRCNLTYVAENNREFSQKFGKNGNFLLSPLSIFNFHNTLEFFEKLELKKEGNKIYPLSEKAKDVLIFLINLLKKNNVKILTSSPVQEIIIENNKVKGVFLDNGKTVEGKSYIICTGGKSYPNTGSSGDAFTWNIEHTITELNPSLTPIEINEKWTKSLQGISLSNIGLSLGNKKYIGEILFTHFGLSGPLILDISKEIGKNIKNEKVKLFLDIFPEMTLEDLNDYFSNSVNKNRLLIKYLSTIIPEKLVHFILNFSSIPKARRLNNLTKEERLRLIKTLKKIEFNVTGLLGFDKAMITSGGFSLKEIDSKNMKSKIINNLYFAGEAIDVDGPSGGYNLQVCWTTGYVAGINSVKNND
ncbi:MAG: NAD(P)/FAD-dependent oxidoreductase [Candidatus Pacebacteria bacterium]|nr:NAD(P)/FAD-dependent oxidoreductase [Candidatus Paceibacterota bacterium]